MKKIKLLCTLIVFIFMTNFCQSQQDAQYTQYMYNTVTVNPAYAGSRDAFRVIGLHRSQWYGLKGAPTTQTLSLDTPINSLKGIGLGLSIINEKIGPSSETYFNIDISYSIPVSEYGKLNFGLKAVGNLLSVDFTKLDLSNSGDPNFNNNINNKFTPNFGFGLYYHTEKFYVGYSIPNLLETNHFKSNLSVGQERINHYLISGYVFNLSEDLMFKPALLTKLVLGTPLQIDLSANFRLYEKFNFGVSYRWSSALSDLIGLQATDSIMIGFSYDRETTELGNLEFNNGSYELLLRYEIKNRNIRRSIPRFF